VTNNSLQGSAIKEAYVAKDGTIYILVEYSLNSVRQNALDAAKKEEALYNEFKANQGFDALEKAISDLD
jgi:bifunctional DNA-binding transcriptional regulator/antitoxin component of YhaV-PrlF toxin-antitoxin module